MDVGPHSRAQDVTVIEGLAVVGLVRHGDARTYGVARSETSAEVGGIGNPQRRDGEMVPAPMLTRPPRLPKLTTAVLAPVTEPRRTAPFDQRG